MVGIFSNTEGVKQDVTSPGGFRHRLDAGKAHGHHTPGTASKPKKFWHPEAKSQLLSTCALQVLLPISYKKMLALINTVVCSLEWPENG